VLGHGADLPRGASRRDNQGIGDAGFAVEIDDDDVVGFIVFE